MNVQLDVIPGLNAIVTENPLLNPPPTLDVTPANQDVPFTTGSTSFAVVSNTSWSAISDQTWCTVTASGSGNGNLIANYSANSSNMPRVASISVSVSGLPDVIVTVTQQGITENVLNLSLLLQGLYGMDGLMNPAMNASGEQWGTDIADIITVELHDATNYATIVYTIPNVTLFTNGNASATFPTAFNGNYFVTIRHRNSIETVSAIPVSFINSVTDYSFDLPAKAFGDNLKLLYDGRYAIFGGDVNQDGAIDIADFSPVDNDQLNFANGYIVTDANGDGTVDIADFSIIDNNQLNFISAEIP